MTKLRTPDSIEDAVTQACGLVGVNVLAMALSAELRRQYDLAVAAGQDSLRLRTISASLVRKWADPDNHASRIDGQSMVATDMLLIKSGHEPVFGPLFDRLRPLGPALGAPPVDPVATAVQATIVAADLMKGVRDAVRDGGLDWPEVAALRARLQELQRELAALNRSLVVRPKAGVAAKRDPSLRSG